MVASSIDWGNLEKKWRKRWDEDHVYESDPDDTRPKYFLTVAYPYPNSPQHIGHGRTYTLTDVHARFMRMRGFNVLLPMAFHYTGTPILAMSKRLEAGDKDLQDTFTEIYGVPKKVLKGFSHPINIARYFHQELKAGMQEIGYGIDWRREFTTVDPVYSRFIEWQFRTLRKKGLISQGSHPVGWCPNDENPVGQHDTIGDVEPEIGEYTVVKFLFNGVRVPTATLRPETIFGVTNIWVNPDTTYAKSSVDGERWIISQECEQKLTFLNHEVVREGVIKGSDLVGQKVTNPITKSLIPILPAPFVDPKTGTGVVMSVPAHAPYDLQALADLRANKEEVTRSGLTADTIRNVKPISIVESHGYSEVPAMDVIKKMGISSQADKKLEEATSELYAHEFHSGTMKPNTMNYSGMKVPEARDAVKRDLVRDGIGDTLYELMNSPVVCRCNTECVVKVFENQWFIDYGDAKWKSLAQECADQMKLLPSEIKSEFDYTVGWLRSKACARKAGLGTKLPWDRQWTIEALSDSVIYMAYYLLAKFVNEHKIRGENVTDEVFDHVFLGRGDLGSVSKNSGLDLKLISEMRREFNYYYPVDARHSGRDLVPNHLTFFIFNHSAIFPKKHWPKQIVVNGSVLMEGKKMSKTYGNIIPLRDAVKTYGADPLRLTILAAAELLADADISLELVRTYRERLEKLCHAVRQLDLTESLGKSDRLGIEDRWLISRLQRHIGSVTEAMSELRVREAIHFALYILDQDVAWYLRRISPQRLGNRKMYNVTMKEVLGVRIKLLAPFAPFLSAELWERMGNRTSILSTKWPEVDDSRIDLEAEEAEKIVQSVLGDIQNITKVTKVRPEKIVLFTASPWKWEAYQKSLETWKKGAIQVGAVIRSLLDDKDVKADPKEVSNFVKLLADESADLSPDAKEIRKKIGRIDESKVLSNAAEFLSRELKAEIHVFGEGDGERYDPKNRARLSRPFRPAIYVE